MYQYKFVKIETKGFLPPKYPAEDYHPIVEQHAEDGWRLVQIFAPSSAPGAFPAYFELIFEKQKDG